MVKLSVPVKKHFPGIAGDLEEVGRRNSSYLCW